MHIPDRLLGIHGVKLADRVLDVDGTSIPHLIAMAWCGAIGSVLLPVVTLPIGPTPAGLPVGIQLS